MITIATRRVLLVEDNPGDVSLVRQCLEGFDSVDLFDVPNVVQANRYLFRKPPFEDVCLPTLVLLDLKLPIFDGTSVLQGIRETPALAHLPVIVFTSSMHPSDRQRCAQLGATDYVQKPTDWGAWQSTIRRIIRRYIAGSDE